MAHDDTTTPWFLLEFAFQGLTFNSTVGRESTHTYLITYSDKD